MVLPIRIFRDFGISPNTEELQPVETVQVLTNHFLVLRDSASFDERIINSQGHQRIKTLKFNGKMCAYSVWSTICLSAINKYNNSIICLSPEDREPPKYIGNNHPKLYTRIPAFLRWACHARCELDDCGT